MRRELLLIQEMIDAAARATALIEGLEATDLEGDRLRSEALLWNFTVLGEAASKLDDEVKSRFPEVDWSRPTRLRNRIVHGYWSADLTVLHATASEDLPGFAARLRDVLATLGATGS
jgi:uncharacterized protein with HEPN domain